MGIFAQNSRSTATGSQRPTEPDSIATQKTVPLGVQIVCRRRDSLPRKPCSTALFIKRMNKIPQPGINLPFPALAVEYAVMTNRRLQMVLFAIRGEFGSQVVGGEGLADGANIVAFAFDGE
jgi:hypothetical protein